MENPIDYTASLNRKIESQQQEIEQLKDENRTLTMSFITCKSKAKYYEEEVTSLRDTIDKWHNRYSRQRDMKLEVIEENIKLKEELLNLKVYMEVQAKRTKI